MSKFAWTGEGQGREVRLNRAARLAALLLLDDLGLLEGHTLQAIADALGEGNDRSTIMRDKRLLPEVRRRRDAAVKRLSVLAADDQLPPEPGR